ncbi:MAG: hypothetical protein J7L95_08185 [Prolixibacteraceae bacterium]|nr:hypothetical protein [Prolixibacteraceae bacterium]
MIVVLSVLFFLIAAGYLMLQNSHVQTYLTQLIANKIAQQTKAKITIGKVDIAFFNKIILEDVLIEGKNADTLFFIKSVKAQIDSLKFRQQKIDIDRLEFRKSIFKIERDSSAHFNFSFLLDSLKKSEPDTTSFWKIGCNKFAFNESSLSYRDLISKKNKAFSIHNLNFELSNLSQKTDSLQFKIENLALNDGKRLFLNHLSADFISTKENIEIKKINLRTKRSAMKNVDISLLFGKLNETKKTMPKVDIRLGSATISFYEIAELVPALKGMNQVVNCSGHIYGDLDDLKGKNILLKTGENTSAFFDFYANGLQNVESMFLFIDLKRSSTSFTDLSKITLPDRSVVKHLSFPESFYQSGLLSYRGNFTGFLTDFVAFGTFSSNMGVLTTDVSVIPNKEGSIIYRGEVKTTDFQFGDLFQNPTFGKLTFNGSVDGTYNKNDRSIFGQYKGKILSFGINNYEYKNMKIDGSIDNKNFDGLLSVNDPNLQFNFMGRVNLNPKIPEFDFHLDLKKANLGNLKLSRNFPKSTLAFRMLANFTGDKLDNLNGAIKLENGSYENKNGTLALNDIELKTEWKDQAGSLKFTSGFFDVGIAGKYNFKSLVNALKKTVDHYLPAAKTANLNDTKINRFDYQLNCKNLDSLTAVFAPQYNIETPFLLYGKVDSENDLFELEGSIPGLSSENLWIKNIFISNKPLNNIYSSKFKFGQILLKNGLTLYNLTVDSKINNNVLDNQVSWSNFHDLTYSGVIKTASVFSVNDSTSTPHIEIKGQSSKIFIADSVWQIAPFTVSIDSSEINVNQFYFSHNDESIQVDGKISADKKNLLSVNFKKINLASFETYLGKKLRLEGFLNGSASLSDFYRQRLIFSNLKLSDVNFRGQKVGNISLNNTWDNTKMTLQSELVVTANNQQSLYAKGSFTPSSGQLNYNAKVNHFPLVVLESVIRNNFSNIKGEASGKIKIHGKPDNILLTGALKGTDAHVTIDYTKVEYHFSDSIYFKGNTILFDSISVYDNAQNRGIFYGTLKSRNFSNMDYDMHMQSKKILAINTTSGDNEQFFGRVYTDGNLSITGHATQVNLTGTATTLPGTEANISLEYESELKKYDFIRFVATTAAEKKQFRFPEKKDSGISLNFTIHATPDAKVQLIYNSQIGDVIKAQGDGILLFGMDKEENITLSGNYTVEKGDYLFTLENVINKRFTIEQGGSLVWSGDPYNALINLNAVYKLKASLYDLLVNNYENVYKNQRIPVECKILLTEQLSNPTIKFKINFPTVEDRIIDELQQFFNTEEEMNKQILSLVVLGKFYTPEYMRGTYEAQNPNLIGTTASELFSNQLSNWLSQISSNVDVGFNYRPGNQITNDEIKLALSTQMFNDRVIINGNIGNNVNPNSNNSNNLVGDFDINVKLNSSGKIQFKAYNRSNNNLIYETAPYTQGVGLIFKEEYNTIGELLRKLGALFHKKNKNQRN